MTLLNGIVLAAALVVSHETPDLEAISRARAAVAISEVNFGANHPATAMMVRNLALCYEKAGYYDRAEVTAKRSLAILEAAFGPADVSITPVLNVLTETYVAEGRYVDARRVGMRAIAIGAGAEAHYATALHNMGAVFEAMGEMDTAREYYRRALATREMWLAADHPYVELTRAALARVERTRSLQARR